MKPVLFELGKFHVYGYGLMIMIGILVAAYIFTKNSKTKGYDEDSVFNLILITVIMGVLGGKILFIVTEIKDIIKNPSILLDFGNGFVVYGAIIFGALAIYAYCRWKKWDTLDLLDSVVPAVAIAQGFGRIGCFLAGCCYGAETTLPIGVVFPNDELSFAPSGVHLHPTQIYSSIFDFILGAFLLYYFKRGKVKGRTFSLYIILYSIGRFSIEFLRNDPRGSVGILSTSQFIAIFTLVFGIIAFYIVNRGKENRASEKK